VVRSADPCSVQMAGDIGRIVALGASNLTRGFHTVVSTARASWGAEVELLAALGHGRSYGAPSSFLCRTLPGILESGLWRELESRPPVPTRGVVTDVGNDILYGFPADQILAWVAEALDRLGLVTDDLIVTDLPIDNIRKLSRWKFLAFRSILVPSCRLSLHQVLETSERVNTGLAALAAAHGARLVRLDPAWYGFDPIHIRPSKWRGAWQTILGSPPLSHDPGHQRLEGIRLYLMPPERRWLCGIEQLTPQSGVRLAAGGVVWVY
jgi:hypothetical protein